MRTTIHAVDPEARRKELERIDAHRAAADAADAHLAKLAKSKYWDQVKRVWKYIVCAVKS